MKENDILKQRQKLFLLRDYFLRKTDKEHPATIHQLIDYLASENVRTDRKTLYTDLDILRDSGLEIESVRGRSVAYYVSRSTFSLSELKLLVDSVQSSRFITQKKSMELINKLGRLTNEYDEKKLRRQVLVLRRVKSMNESIFKNVDAIQEAILYDCKIGFRYFDYAPSGEKVYRKDGRAYIASPFSLVWSNDNYYLLAYEGGKLKHFRVDKMEKPSTLYTQTPREGKEAFESMDMATYTNKVFSMYSGKERKVKLRFSNHLAGAVLDRFGKENVFIVPDGEKHFTVSLDVEISPQFFGWLCGLGRGVVIVWPDDVAKEMYEYVRGIASKYEEFFPFADDDGE